MPETRMSETMDEYRDAVDENSSMLEYARYLSQVVGPRPAGTEEEQQASFYIQNLLQEGAELKTEVEEFNCNPNFELPRVVCCIVSAVLAILSLILPLTIVPALILSIIFAIFYSLEVFGMSPFTKRAKRGISQNIVGKYIPEIPEGEDRPTTRRKRKIIFIAHYDTGKVRSELRGPLFSALNVIHWIELGGMVFIPLILLLRLAFSADGVFLIVLNVLIVISAIGAFLPVISYIMHQTAPYNNGANCNAAGVALMAEIADRVSHEIPIAHSVQSEVKMHGEQEIRDLGLIPEGAEFSYKGESNVDGRTTSFAPYDMNVDASSSETVVADVTDPVNSEILEVEGANNNYFGGAKQGITTGAGVDAIFEGVGKSSPIGPQDEAVSQDALNVTTTVVSTPESLTGVQTSFAEATNSNSDLPDWFKRGMQKANENKPAGETESTSKVQRSRFADALDAAAATTAEAQAERDRASNNGLTDIEVRLQQMRESIKNYNPHEGMGADQQVHGTEILEEQIQERVSEGTQLHGNAGVDGYLSSTLESPDYATAAAAAAVESRIEDEAVVDQAASERSVTVSSEVRERAASASGEIRSRIDAAAAAQNEAKAERAAKVNETISFIPVEVDQDVISDVQVETEIDERSTPSVSVVDVSAATNGDHDSEGPIETKGGRRRRSISLPSITGSLDGVSSHLQDAPIADAAEGMEQKSEEEIKQQRLARQGKLANAIPTIQDAGGADDPAESENTNVMAGAFIDASGTSSFKPVGDELIADIEEDDIYIEDADDSDYATQITSTGALAGPGYVEMPKSRASRVFGRFRRNKKNKEDVMSFKESLGLQDNFDAREVGKARGGWESFRDDDFDDWEGGSSRSSSRRRKPIANPFGDIPLELTDENAEQRELIHQFKNGAINTEIWFVALGAELADNAGIKAFLNEHIEDLRGSILIDLNGLGEGELSLIEEEGMFRPIKVSSRLKRIATKSASSLGIKLGSGKMLWRDSGAYITGRKGFQTLHIAGMMNGKPAHCAEVLDVWENLDPQTLEQNADFVMELIRNI